MVLLIDFFVVVVVCSGDVVVEWEAIAMSVTSARVAGEASNNGDGGCGGARKGGRR